MGFDLNSVPEQVLRSIALGLVTTEQAVADTLCTKFTEKTTLSGRVPVLSSKATMARADNVGLGPGEEPKAHGGKLKPSTPYNCLAYVGYDEITDEERNDLSVFSLDYIADRVRQARVDSNMGVDLKLQEILESTSLNTEFDVTSDGNGAWTDKVNSTPLEDMVEAKHTFCPGADTIIYGPAIKRALLAHPDLIAEYSQFNAGALDIDGLSALIARKTGITNVQYVEKFYDSANEGQAVSVTYLFDTLFWMGHKRDLVMVDPANAAINNKAEIERVVSRRLHQVQHTRYIDILRNTQELGAVFSNVA